MESSNKKRKNIRFKLKVKSFLGHAIEYHDFGFCIYLIAIINYYRKNLKLKKNDLILETPQKKDLGSNPGTVKASQVSLGKG